MDKNQRIEWTKERVLHMIDKWMEFDCLYNPQHRLYHNKNARNDALVRIVDSLKPSMPNVTVNDVKTKICYLRSQFCREVHRQKEIIRNAENVDDIHSPTPYWYEKLNNLNRFVRARKGRRDTVEEYDSMDDNSFQFQNDSIDELSYDEMPQASKRLRLSDIQSLDQAAEIVECSIKPEPDNMAILEESIEYPKQTNRAMECSPQQTVEVKPAPAPKQNIAVTSTQVAGCSNDRETNRPMDCSPKQTVEVKPASVPKQTVSSTQVASCSNDQEYDAVFLNFIKVNLSLVTDVTLKDELTDKITMLLLEYKGKQRRLK